MFKRKRDGIWYASIHQDGNRVFRSLKTRDEVIARSREDELLNLGKIITLSFIKDEWLESIKNKSARYRHDASCFIDQFTKWHGDCIAETIVHMDLVNYKHYLQTETQDKKAYKNNSVGFHFRCIKAMFNYSVRADYLIKSPFRNFKIDKVESRKEFLTRTQIQDLFSVEKDELNRLFIEFMLRTGCRVNELSQLRFSDIDDQFINFIGAKGKPRQFPILRNKEIKEALNKIDKLQNKNRDYVLSNRDGFWLGRHNWLSKMVKKNMNKAGFPKSFCTHLLRATFATQLIYRGENMAIVSKLLGHGSIQTTERHYAHIEPKYIQINTNYLNI